MSCHMYYPAAVFFRNDVYHYGLFGKTTNRYRAIGRQRRRQRWPGFLQIVLISHRFSPWFFAVPPLLYIVRRKPRRDIYKFIMQIKNDEATKSFGFVKNKMTKPQNVLGLVIKYDEYYIVQQSQPRISTLFRRCYYYLIALSPKTALKI